MFSNSLKTHISHYPYLKIHQKEQIEDLTLVRMWSSSLRSRAEMGEDLAVDSFDPSSAVKKN